MDVHKIRGEDHYQCREVKAERDMLKAKLDDLTARLAAAEAALDDLRRKVLSVAEHRNVPCSGGTACGDPDCGLVSHNHVVCVSKEAHSDLQAAIDAARGGE